MLGHAGFRDVLPRTSPGLITAAEKVSEQHTDVRGVMETTPDKNQKVHVGVCGQCLDVHVCKNIACGCPRRNPADCAYSMLEEPIKPSTLILLLQL